MLKSRAGAGRGTVTGLEPEMAQEAAERCTVEQAPRPVCA